MRRGSYRPPHVALAVNTLSAVLVAYRTASGRDAALWEFGAADRTPMLVAVTDRAGVLALAAPEGGAHAIEQWASDRGWRAYAVGTALLPAFVVVGPAAPFTETGLEPAVRPANDQAPSTLDTADRFLIALLPRVRRLVQERDGATAELAERYEEISLLYAIGELLGGGASVESVAFTVLRELAQTVGAPRGAIMLHDPVRDLLVPTALLGVEPSTMSTVSARDTRLAAVRAFVTGEACTEEGGALAQRSAPLLSSDGGPLLAVPIRRTSMDGTTSLGTVLLAGRAGDAPFTAGDRKLVMAIASQVGTALHNARLVRAALDQEQLAREMRLAHDLQLKLLPPPHIVGPEARAAARVVPAESVGGDFYLLARLAADRTGVVIGDVSGHGYQAALVMALAMSAAAIHVQAVVDPAVALDAVRRSLADELDSTEMSITLFYGVLDEADGVLRFANAGHPHAFVQRANGACERLAASIPPLGFADGPIAGSVVPLSPGDRLVLFTDGVTDARNAAGDRFGEPAVLAACACGPDATPDDVLDAVFESVRAFVGDTPLLDDLAVVVVDRVGHTARRNVAPSLAPLRAQRAPA